VSGTKQCNLCVPGIVLALDSLSLNKLRNCMIGTKEQFFISTNKREASAKRLALCLV